MNKSLFLLVLILATLLSSCGKKLEDSDKSNEDGNTRVAAHASELNKAKELLFSAIGSNDTLLVRTALSKLSNLDFSFSSGETPLTEAIKTSKSEIIIEILNKSNIVNKANKFHEIPASLIIISRRLERSEKRDIIKKLLTQNLEIDKRGINGITAIEVAIRSKQEAIAMILTKKGANVTEAYNGDNLVELASAYKLERLTLLLNDIAKVVTLNADSMLNAIKASNRNLLEYFVNKIKNSAKMINEKNLLIETLKIQNINERRNILNYLLGVTGVKADGSGVHQTPLIFAATQFQSTHKRSLTYLIQAGANIFHKDNYGNSALDYAARNLNVENVSFLYRRILMTSRDTFNTPGSQSSNAIISACDKTPSKNTAERILWNGKMKRSQILRELRCPFN